ncbi:hypothetical protein EB077_01295 [bacterium]|nr:hypothetical protein [bacterium]
MNYFSIHTLLSMLFIVSFAVASCKTVLVFIPVYSENRKTLESTFTSVVECEKLNTSCIMFIVVDGKIKGFSS